jgi:hypothetical protein
MDTTVASCMPYRKRSDPPGGQANGRAVPRQGTLDITDENPRVSLLESKVPFAEEEATAALRRLSNVKGLTSWASSSGG